MKDSNSLKGKVVKGGFYLALRQIIASAFSLVSTLVIARLLGPETYGIVVASLGIFHFLRWSSRLGLQTYLIRKPDLQIEEASQIFVFYTIFGLVLTFLCWSIAPAFGWWIGRDEITQILKILLPLLWIDLLGLTSNSMMLRELRFDQVGIIQSLSQIANYLLSVPVVLVNGSYWGPVWGTMLQIFLDASLIYYCYPVPWRFSWKWAILKPALNYGLTFHTSSFLYLLRSLTVPMLVGRLVGVEAVGVLNIATRMVDQLMLLREVVRQMSISVMAKLMEDAEATLEALSKGMSYQALLLGLVCALFSSCASWLIPIVFGSEWLVSARIFPLVGIAALVGGVFDLHSGVLYALGRNQAVSVHNFTYLLFLWIVGCIAMPLLGIWGYGISEILAAPSYFLIHRSVEKIYGSPQYGTAFCLIIASVPSSICGIWFGPLINLTVFVISYGVLFALIPDARKVVMDLWVTLKFKKNTTTHA